MIVTAPSIAEAWDDLYYLERAASVQIRAMATGRALRPIPAHVAQANAPLTRDPHSARLHLDSVKRLLTRAGSDFAS